MSRQHTKRNTAVRPGAERRAAGQRPEWQRGIVDVLPLLVGYLPFGLLVGATVSTSGPVFARWLSSILIMSGSGQLAVLGMLDGGSGLVLIVVTALILNSRLVSYSASLAPHWARETRRFRVVAAASIIDPTWALAHRRLARPGDQHDRRRYYVAAATTMCASWVAMITVGMMIGRSIGPAGVAIAVPLCLFAMVAPGSATRDEHVVLVVAGVLAWVGSPLPAGTGMLLAIASGAAVGVLAESRRGRP